MQLSMVIAYDRDRGMGKDNALLVHVPGDLPRFKSLTIGHPIIMGRKTFESIGRVLPGRTNIVITRQTDYAPDGVVVVNSLEAAITAAAAESDRATVIGGAQICTEALPRTDTLYITELQDSYGADVFFPEVGPEFTVTEQTDWTTEDGVTFRYITYQRQSNG